MVYIVYEDHWLFWEHPQSNIDKILKYFKEYGPRYNREKSREGSVYEFLGLDINILDYDVFQLSKTELICKILEATWMDNCNDMIIPTRVEAPLGVDDNVIEAKRDCPNLYASVIGMMLYLSLNTILYTSFDFHQCTNFPHHAKS